MVSRSTFAQVNPTSRAGTAPHGPRRGSLVTRFRQLPLPSEALRSIRLSSQPWTGRRRNDDEDEAMAVTVRDQDRRGVCPSNPSTFIEDFTPMPAAPPAPLKSTTNSPSAARSLPSPALSARRSGGCPSRARSASRDGAGMAVDPAFGPRPVRCRTAAPAPTASDKPSTTPWPVADARWWRNGAQTPLQGPSAWPDSRPNVDLGDPERRVISAEFAGPGPSRAATAGDHGEWSPGLPHRRGHLRSSRGVATDFTVQTTAREPRPKTTTKTTRQSNPTTRSRTRSTATTNPTDDLTTTTKTTIRTITTTRSRSTQGPRSNQPHEAQTFAGFRSGNLRTPNPRPLPQHRNGSAAALRGAGS